MSVPITRTSITNDDGSGTTGTIADSAFMTTLYDQIDAALLGGVTQSTTATGTQNNFALTAGCSLLLCGNASLLALTGLVGGVNGQVLRIIALGASASVELHPEFGSSTAANRMTTGVGSYRTLGAGGSATLVYDGVTSRWVVVQHEQNAWVNIAYAAGDFTGSGAMTWTVEAGDVNLFAYRLAGRTLHVKFDIGTSSVGGTPSTALIIAIPAGFVAKRTSTSVACVILDNSASVVTPALSVVVAAGTTFAISRQNNATLTASTNLTYTYGEMVFEVQ